MKKLIFLFVVVFLFSSAFPASAQVVVSADIENLPVETLAAALVNNPEAMRNLIPQIIDALVKNPEEFTEIIVYLLSSEEFLKTFLKNLPAISEYLPAIFLKLPEILSILPQILNEIVPRLDLIINNILAVLESGDSTLYESISRGINNVLFLAFDNSNLITENIGQIISTILSYEAELISVLIRILPVLPAIVANLDIQTIISLLFSSLSSIEEMLKAVLSALSTEEFRHLFLLLLQILPTLLPAIVGILAHLLLSKQSIFLIAYSMLSSVSLHPSVSLHHVMSFGLGLISFIVQTIILFPTLFSYENLSFFVRNLRYLIIDYLKDIRSLQGIGHALKSKLESNYVLVNDMLVPKWLIG